MNRLQSSNLFTRMTCIYFSLWLTVLHTSAYSQNDDIYIPITPYRSVNEQHDNCQHIGRSKETIKFIELGRNEIIDTNQLSTKALLELANWYLTAISVNHQFSEWVREHAKITRQAICQHLLDKIPDTGFNLDTLADLNSVEAKVEGARVSTNNLQEYEYRSGYPKTNYDLTLIPILVRLFIIEGHYIFPDKFFIARLKKAINGARQITQGSPVLEIAAGHGIIAKELNKQHIPITAIDDFSDLSMLRSKNQFVQTDDATNATNAINTYHDHKVYLGFSIPIKLEDNLYKTILSKSGPRILFHSRAKIHSIYKRRSELITALKDLFPNRNFYIDELNMAVPIIYGYEPMIIVYSDDTSRDRHKWDNNIKKIKKLKVNIETMLANQIKGNKKFNRSPLEHDEL